MSTSVAVASLLLALFVTAINAERELDDDFSARATTTVVASITSYPYIASVTTPAGVGVATVIHKFYLVTKKELVSLYVATPTSVTIKYGALNVITSGTSITAKEILLHPTATISLALIKVTCPGIRGITFPKLPATGSAQLTSANSVKVVTWGVNLAQVEEITTTIGTSAFCNQKKSVDYKAATHYCTEVLLLGIVDSGAPMIRNGILYGVTTRLSSATVPATTSEEYLNMAIYRAWIETTTGYTYA